MTTETDVLTALKSNAKSLSLDTISENSINLAGTSYPADAQCSFSAEGATLSYSLASLVLLLQDPSGTILNYKKLCRKYNVQDSVKTSEKDIVVKYFLGSEASSSSNEIETESKVDSVPAKREKRVKIPEAAVQKDKEHKSLKNKDDEKGAKKKDKYPITQEQIMENLNIVVDKRGEQVHEKDKTNQNISDSAGGLIEANDGDEPPKLLLQEEEERRAVQACLSAAGYEATAIPQDVMDKDRAEVTEKITSFEIPVGDSASILRCGAVATNTFKRKATSETSQRNFARVLELYTESLVQSQNEKRESKRPRPSTEPTKKANGKPIIIVPNAMTSPITLLNSIDFFQNSQYVPREVAVTRLTGPKPTSVFVKRPVSSRLGGGVMEYEIMDNPVRKLQSSADWDRIVAVIAQGAAWQFKGWRAGGKRDAEPVDIFSNSFGYFIGFEGAPIPKDLQGWSVKQGFMAKQRLFTKTTNYTLQHNGMYMYYPMHYFTMRRL